VAFSAFPRKENLLFYFTVPFTVMLSYWYEVEVRALLGPFFNRVWPLGLSAKRGRQPLANSLPLPPPILEPNRAGRTNELKALVLKEPGQAEIRAVADPVGSPRSVLLKVRMVGFCGSDLNSFRGRNPLVSFPRIPGHEVSATIVEGSHLNPALSAGADVTLSPYSSCGTCAACSRGRPNACQFNETLGVQRDGAATEYIVVPSERIYPANLTLKELCLVEPLTVGFHAVARGRVTAEDTVAILGCGGVGLGVVAACGFRGAKTIGVDMDDEKLNTARAAGAAHSINTAKEDLHQRLDELTDGRGPDVVIEAIGLPQTFRAAVEEVAFTGRVVYIGYAKEAVAYETRLFVQKELDILGSRNALPEDFRE
jgi:threonine dehydrogenase-like Zn-dependent dehydrogenase